ncbi:MAG: TatD family hydrolase [Nitrososphaerota archaeon]|nr:TatD family hydrolase [Aigarchaeota archaeon]MDW8076023.1 TatD family hydrolase [Nitrososphaerota archaeon]
MLVDVHCHLTDETIAANLAEVVEDAKKSGVAVIVTSGLGYRDCLKALEISDYKTIFPSFGIMPYELEGYEDVLDLIERYAKKIVAIGEVGLDFHINLRPNKELQRKVFREFIELSLSLDLPLIVHSRSAGKYALEMLSEFGAKDVIMHAFDGSASHSLIGIEKGYFFSVPPSVVRSEQKQKLVSKIPLDNILLESDAPALSPTPNTVNFPSNVRISAEVVSRIKGVPLEKVEEITTENAMRILRITV